MAARGQHKYSMQIWAAAALVHLGLFGIWQGGDAIAPDQPQLDAPIGNEAGLPLAVSSVALVEYISDPTHLLGTTLTPTNGASDRAAADQDGALTNSSDAPGNAVGRRAAGIGGDESFSDRRDRDLRSASTWNTKRQTVMPHAGDVARGETSPESLARSPSRAFSDQEVRRVRAQSGDKESVAGIATSQGAGGHPGSKGDEWLAADPRFDFAPTQKREFVSGAVQAHREAAKMDRGATSTEQAKRGKAAESLRTPDRSNRKDTSAFHLGAPSAGTGAGTGAQGRSGSSTADNGGHGSAAQSGDAPSAGLAATRASRRHPYFNEMYRRIDRELRFPKKLALALEQGDLVLAFQLDKNGRIRSLKIRKGSGFAEFDAEAVRAFRQAAPFGKVPNSLLGARDRVAVVAPYYFRNPLIR
jgi:TonB family protein